MYLLGFKYFFKCIHLVQLPELLGCCPRPVIIKLHYFQDKGKFLNAVKSKGPLRFQGSKIYFVQDFYQLERQKIRGFNAVCEKLKKLIRNVFPRHSEECLQKQHDCL